VRPAVEPDRAKAGGVRARDIASEAIADHDRIRWCEVERRQRCFEDATVGLPDVDLSGDDRGLEQRRECGVRELLALHVGRAVGHERKPVVARQIIDHRLGVGIDQLRPAARGTKRVHRPPDEVFIGEPGGGERAGPDAAAEVRHERAQRPQPYAVAQELAPQRFSPPDPHRIRIGEPGRFAKQLFGGFARRRDEVLDVGPGPAGDRGARLPERALRRIVLEQQRVIEVEEDGSDACAVSQPRAARQAGAGFDRDA
jgi:hypothetical protein